MKHYRSSSLEETRSFAQKLAPLLGGDRIVCFFGPLASGKTTLIKGLCQALDVPENQVSSPTFVYLNIYQGTYPIYHFDLYRLKDSDQFLASGFEEFLFKPGLKFLEWSERIASLIPKEAVRITLANCGEACREIRVEGLLTRDYEPQG